MGPAGAAACSFPTADIGRMVDEIERGYQSRSWLSPRPACPPIIRSYITIRHIFGLSNRSDKPLRILVPVSSPRCGFDLYVSAMHNRASLYHIGYRQEVSGARPRTDRHSGEDSVGVTESIGT